MYDAGSISPSRTGTQVTRAPRASCASQICPIVGNSASVTTTPRRPRVKSIALATALVASDTELKTAISSGEALISFANACLARSTSPIHASQSMPSRARTGDNARSPRASRASAAPASSCSSGSSTRAAGCARGARRDRRRGRAPRRESSRGEARFQADHCAKKVPTGQGQVNAPERSDCSSLRRFAPTVGVPQIAFLLSGGRASPSATETTPATTRPHARVFLAPRTDASHPPRARGARRRASPFSPAR